MHLTQWKPVHFPGKRFGAWDRLKLPERHVRPGRSRCGSRSIVASNGVQEPIYLRSDGRVAEGNRRVVALRAGKKILYDGPNMKVTNVPQANDFLRREYREGWNSPSGKTS